MAKRALVFCSSSNDVAPVFFSEMNRLGTSLAKNGFEVVYGGSDVGLMGELANSALKAGGVVKGVIPEYFNTTEVAHDKLTELTVVGNLVDRKRRMMEMSDYIVAFPGGMGTVDEVTEAIALKQVGEIDKPIFLVNVLGFWQQFMVFMEELKQQKMISQDLNDLVILVEDSEELLKHLNGRGA